MYFFCKRRIVIVEKKNIVGERNGMVNLFGAGAQTEVKEWRFYLTKCINMNMIS